MRVSAVSYIVYKVTERLKAQQFHYFRQRAFTLSLKFPGKFSPLSFTSATCQEKSYPPSPTWPILLRGGASVSTCCSEPLKLREPIRVQLAAWGGGTRAS